MDGLGAADSGRPITVDGLYRMISNEPGLAMSRGHLYRLVDGTATPRLDVIEALANFFKVPASYFVDDHTYLDETINKVDAALREVDNGLVEAAQSMGASTLQIVWKVYLPEAKPSLILGGAISLVTILAYTAIAGTVGAGGLGDIAVRYGHQRGITSVMWVTVVFLIILVQVVQLIFNWLSRRIDKRLDQPSGAKKSGPLDLLPRFAHTK